MRLSLLALFALACNPYKDDADPGVVVGDTGQLAPVDADGDGYTAVSDGGDDCDDGDASVHPDAEESCDGVDNNCDGAVDEGVQSTWYADADGDGYGDPGASLDACGQPSGYVSDATDCDDGDGAVSPDGAEVCDGVDNDCDGTVDEDDAADAETWYADSDGDGYGDAASSVAACEAPSGYVSDATDCDDGDGAVSPDETEVCDGVDNDCDGMTDEDDAADAATWYADSDGDGYGDAGVSTASCEAPSGYVSDATDCDDGDGAVSPEGEEVCDGVDNDCDGTVDEDDATDAATWYADSDGDGYGDADTTATACEAPSGYLADDTDCDDTDATLFPESDGTCALGTDCLDLLGRGYSSDDTYTVDADGAGTGDDPYEVWCDMSTDGGGWTLIAINDPTDTTWDSTLAVDATTFGDLTGGDYKGESWNDVGFTDLLFDDGTLYAIYGGIGDGTTDYYTFQAAIPLHNCGSTDGYSYAMTDGTLAGGTLCDTNLYFHPVDEDGGVNTTCAEGYEWGQDAFGPTWSTASNNGCPLDDPLGTSFWQYNTHVPWSTTDELMMLVR